MRGRLLAGLLLLSSSAGSLLVAAPTAAAELPAVMLVVDVSGSMAERDVAGTVKLDGARNGIGAFLAELPEGTPTGLRTYPSGTGDCGSGRLVEAPQPLRRSRLGAEVRGLQADGGTPTAQALLAAFSDLRAAGHTSGTVVLVSDGESNCPKDGPVCTVAEGLESLGVDVTVNTVGFDISPAGRAELECIARATGGVYSDVQSAGDLVDRLNEIAEGRLDVQVDAPSTVRMAVGTAQGAGPRISATVTNPGVRPARDVRVVLQMVGEGPDGTADAAYVAVADPTRRLGALAPGERRTVSWTFRPPIDFRSTRLRYRVLAGPFRGAAVEATGVVDVTSQIVLTDGGPLLRDKKHVVVMGDSYSAGEGAGSYAAGTDTLDNTCHRSARTYATPLFPDLTNLACSGAVTADVYRDNAVHRVGGAPLPAQVEQLQQLRDSGTVPDLVLLTLGGNDIGFSDVIFRCVLAFDCTSSVFDVKPTALEKLSGQALTTGLTEALSRISAVVNAPQALAARGGTVAPLVLLGYPQLFPGEAGKAVRCQGYLTADEIAFANELVAGLNSGAAALVEQLRTREDAVPVFFAGDVESAFLPDHTMCGAAPWAHELQLQKAVPGAVSGKVAENEELLLTLASGPVPFQVKTAVLATVGGAEATRRIGGEELRTYKHAYHPTADGYRAMTAALLRWSGGEDAARPVPELGPDPLDGAPGGPLQGDPVVLQAGADGGVLLELGADTPLTVSGLPPSTAVEVLLRSSPLVLARGTTGADGQLATTVHVPAAVEPGRHRLQVVGLADGEVLVDVAADLPRRRPGWWLPTGVTASGLLLLGGGLLAQRRRVVTGRA